ncbi:Alpha/beta hydrolase fold precursor [Winogradskyella psychrotolerans RS-3]|uniref:Alpha/beta hydrolase fold n=1 Tax=Winogradskyella psychrotolerans RS-3 TaxID=641526 RepID=S7VVB6_9FLAO|nr:alpha/beta hydrolase [Winogradskyella psychrotolerans]EPR73312.1 Alpha/beta hydrolase fold precursor [Winogradskyella psychrotolerans RS-3]
MKNLVLTVSIVLLFISCKETVTSETDRMSKTTTSNSTSEKSTLKYKTLAVNGINIAYREAGNPKNPTIVLLHGFPASSYQYRKVLAQLSNEFHLIAPDYPGFGNSDFPDAETYTYTFDNIATTIDSFLEQKEINSYAIMIQDYGAPIGFRLATAHPERIAAIINQNGNAYEEGLGDAWAGIKALWKNRTKETEDALLTAFSLEGLKWQYTHGVRDIETVDPDSYNLDFLRLSRPNAHAVNLDLFYDYQNNVKLYPKWQDYLRDNQPPLLIVWGKNDAFFPESGAEAFKKDVKDIDYNIYDTGHFALEEEGDAIIESIRNFMRNQNK